MEALLRIGVTLLAAVSLSVPTVAWADSPNAGDTVLRSQTSQLSAHFQTIDGSGCIRNDLFIHSVLEQGAIDASVQSVDLCTNTLLLLTGGTAWNADVRVDSALQNGHAAGTIVTMDRLTGTTLPVTVDLNWTGRGGLTTSPFAPGLSPGTIGFHFTTPWVNVTYTGVGSARAATMSGSMDIPGFTFPAASAQSDFTVLTGARSEFIIALKHQTTTTS